MQCTFEEIEEKRRQAKLRLQNNKKRYGINTFSGNNNENYLSNNETCSPQKLHMNKEPEVKVLYQSPKQSNFLANRQARQVKPYEKIEKSPSQFYGNNKPITASCSLISDDRFVVELSGYSSEIINLFKTFPTRSYEPSTRQWNFHISEYDLLMQKLLFLKPQVVVGKIPIYAIKCCNMPKPDYSLIDLSKIDSELLSALMPFQLDGVCFGIDKDGRCLIADEMGLGKTFQALAIASYFKHDWPLLIVTTSSMKKVWEETIHNYLPSVSVLHTQYMVSAKDYIGESKILIVSHDLLQRCVDKLEERNFGVIIIDESHTLKNFKAKCTGAANNLCKIAKRVILLSGTPALSRPSELYTQLSFLDDKFFGNFINYSKRYCDGKKTQFGWDANGVSNLKELSIILAKKFMIRRTKEDVLKMLPDKVQEVVSLDVKLNNLCEEDRKKLSGLAQKYCQNKKAIDKQAALLTYFAESAKIKIPSVCSYILQLSEVNKFIVFAHHQVMLNAIEQILIKSNRQYIRIDGNTSSDKRKALVDKFQLNDSYECALLSITAANAGITLTKANLVLFAELHWNPSILSQAESRAHRIGQNDQVNVKYLIAQGTADDYIWPMLQEKQKVLNGIGLCKDYYENVSVTKQNDCNERIAGCLNSSLTSANTLDISTYFSSPTKDTNNDVFFDDGFDDVLANVDF